MSYSRLKIVLLLLGILPLTPACGPSGDGPAVPEVYQASYEGSSGNGDLGTDDEEPQGLSPRDSLLPTRLDTLPTELVTRIEECERGGKFFSIGKSLCTEQALSEFPCRIDETFQALLNESTLIPLEDYLNTKVKNHQLYACTADSQAITLHFFHYQDNRISYRELAVVRGGE